MKTVTAWATTLTFCLATAFAHAEETAPPQGTPSSQAPQTPPAVEPAQPGWHRGPMWGPPPPPANRKKGIAGIVMVPLGVGFLAASIAAWSGITDIGNISRDEKECDST